MSNQVSYRSIVSMAWPIVLANAAVPLLGLVDTTIIGNVGDTQQLGSIALGSLIFSFIYWSFGFLRMSTTGFTAQAAGAGNSQQIVDILLRALLLAILIGGVIFIIHKPLSLLIFYLLDSSEAVEHYAADYFLIRIWGAPASLATFALMGTLIGLGKSRLVLVVQLFLNGLNIILDLIFAAQLNLGVQGIAIGTLISEWATVIFALLIVYWQVIRPIDKSSRKIEWLSIANKEQLIKMLLTNRDIFIRTVSLIFAFAWFTDQSAQLGDPTLASNHILLQFISFSAFFLDGFAFVAEALVGKAIGSKKLLDFDLAVRRSSYLAAATALMLAIAIAYGGNTFILFITDITEVREKATDFLWFSVLYVAVSFGAFQLDGIFIGAVRAEQMRNASVFSTLFFLVLSWPLSIYLGNVGLWSAFIAYVLCRAIALAFYFPALRQQIQQS